MIRFLFRLLSTVSLAIAVIMAVLDATRTVAASGLVLSSLRESWAATSPDTLAAHAAAQEAAKAAQKAAAAPKQPKGP